MAIGGRFKWNDQGETPNTMFGIAEFPNGQHVFFNVRNVNYKGYQHQVENEYYFEDGGKIVRRKKTAKYCLLSCRRQERGEGLSPSRKSHARRATGPLSSRPAAPAIQSMANGTALDAHYSSLMGHLMNNSYRLGKKVPFNAKAGRFGDDKEAHEHFMKLHAIMHDGVGVPEDKAEYIVGPWLTFDPQTERHVGEHAAEANALLKDANNPGFQVPLRENV